MNAASDGPDNCRWSLESFKIKIMFYGRATVFRGERKVIQIMNNIF